MSGSSTVAVPAEPFVVRNGEGEIVGPTVAPYNGWRVRFGQELVFVQGERGSHGPAATYIQKRFPGAQQTSQAWTPRTITFTHPDPEGDKTITVRPFPEGEDLTKGWGGTGL